MKRAAADGRRKHEQHRDIRSCVSCCVGYPLAIVMRGVGWPILMMLFPPFEVFAGTVIIEFIPRLIFLPSDRCRYGLDRRHRRNR